VLFAYLYGSWATATARPDSDIDVAVFIEDVGGDRLVLASEVADRLGAAAELGSIEVVVLNEAPLRFQGRVLRDRVVLFNRDEPKRVAYESLTGRMADDVEIWAADTDREILAAIAEGRR
jgi:predicted nucleotidyltransferase